MALTDKRRLFVDHYLQTWNATEAARRAGYSEKGIEVQACNLRKDPEIDAAIKERLNQEAMTADEVLHRLAEQARGAASRYIAIGSDGKPYLDVESAIEDGRGHLIKGITYTKSGDVVVQTYDAHAALVDLGRAHGLFKDGLDLTSKGEQLNAIGIDVILPQKHGE